MLRTQIQLSEEQMRRLKDVAAERGLSIAGVIREAVDAHLSEHVTPMARRQKAIASIGGFHSGRHDVSVEHDRELAEAYLD